MGGKALLLLALLLLTLVGCSAHSSAPANPVAEAGLPALSALPPAPRQGSAASVELIDDDVLQARGLSWDLTGKQLQLLPDEQFAYVVFGLSDPGGLESLELSTSAAGGEAWLLLSDFATQRWRNVGQLSGAYAELVLGPGSYSNAGGTLYIALLAPGSGWAGRLSCTFNTTLLSPPPGTPEVAVVPAELEDNYAALLAFLENDNHTLLQWLDYGSLDDRRAAMYYMLQYDNLVLSDLGLTTLIDGAGSLDFPLAVFVADAGGEITTELTFDYRQADGFYIRLPATTRGELAWYGEQAFARFGSRLLSVSVNQSGPGW
jgi:hypothetical protein